MTRGKKIAPALEGEIITPAEGKIITPKAAKHIDKMNRAWARGIMGFIEIGQFLIEAKADCAHGEWQVVLEEVTFGKRQAYRLMALRADSRLVTHESHLPHDSYTLYLLMRLPLKRFEEMVADGTIHPDMTRQDASAATRREARAKDEKRVAKLGSVAGKFKTLVVDPPWDSDWYSKTAGHPPYATMTLDDILALPVGAWAEGECHLYLWTPNNFLPLAVQAMEGWGFKHKSVLTWIKPKIARGHYFRNSTEQVLFGTRGKSRTRADDIPTHFEAPVGAHSEKPDIFYDIVRRASYPAYGEAFQGQPREDFKNLFEVKGDG